MCDLVEVKVLRDSGYVEQCAAGWQIRQLCETKECAGFERRNAVGVEYIGVNVLRCVVCVGCCVVPEMLVL